MDLATRRCFLTTAGAGFGAVAFAALRARASAPNPLAPKPTHHPAKAKAVIWCFLDGGASHIDTFDPKPALQKFHGQPLPETVKRPITAMGVTAGNPLMASTRKFSRHGRSGLWVSDLLPDTARHADELCVIRSCVADGLTHAASVLQMNTTSLIPGRPCLGAWSVYGLGSVADDLPGFVVMADNPSEPPGGPPVWGNGFLPSPYQGTRFAAGPAPVLYAAPPPGVTPGRQRGRFDLIQQANRRYAAARPGAGLADGQLAAYELAYRMQASAPAAADLSKEPAETLELYGLDRKETEANGRNCLLARRLVERGVRFVQLFMGAGSKWDAHADLNGNHEQWCRATDRPVAGLLTDLKRRGMLDSTLVIWGGEFGRTPMSESGNGRDHNPTGFTVWMAGGGVKPGVVYGATDEFGLHAVENRVHVRDLHATVLHLLGMDHERLTYLHNGREELATGVGGTAVTAVVG